MLSRNEMLLLMEVSHHVTWIQVTNILVRDPRNNFAVRSKKQILGNITSNKR